MKFKDESNIKDNFELVNKKVVSTSTNYYDAENILFAGSLILAGSANAIVIEIGIKTALGIKLEEASTKKHMGSKLYQDLNVFFYGSFIIATFVNIIFITIGLLTGVEKIQLVDLVIGIYIAILPEGIPALVKLLLYTTATKLGKKGIYLREIEYAEIVGNITICCADKEALTARNSLILIYYLMEQI